MDRATIHRRKIARTLIEVDLLQLRRNCDTACGPWIAPYIVVNYTEFNHLLVNEQGDLHMTASNFRPVAAHVLRHLARAQARGRSVRLDELACDIGVRHEDVRHVVTNLHAEGHVDAKRMRLTMSGLALATAMRECKLREARIRERPSQMNVA
jgi:hypothetical protein